VREPLPAPPYSRTRPCARTSGVFSPGAEQRYRNIGFVLRSETPAWMRGMASFAVGEMEGSRTHVRSYRDPGPRDAGHNARDAGHNARDAG